MTGTSHFELVDPIFFEFLAKHGLTYIGWDFSSVDLRYACVGLAQNGSPLYIVSIHRVENGKATVALLDSEKSTEIIKAQN